MPKVSVIIPVYSVERYIGRCVESLFGQTLDDMEFVFVDDCTPDRSMEVMREVLERYPHRKAQVREVRLDAHRGQAVGRRAGVEVATGDFVTHCDSDDYVDSDMCRALYQAAVDSGYEMVYCGIDIVQGNHRTRRTEGANWLTSPREVSQAVFAGLINGSLCRGIAARHLYDKVRHWPVGNVYEDQLILHQLLYACSTQVGYLGRTMYHYVMHVDQTTSLATREQLISYTEQHALNAAPLARFLREAKVPRARLKLVEYELTDKFRLRRLEDEPDYAALQHRIHPSLTVAKALFTRGLSWGKKREFYRMRRTIRWSKLSGRKRRAGSTSRLEQHTPLPKVTVIIPVYKVERWMAGFAEELFRQTIKEVEFLFVDDCTPDRSVEVMREVLERYPERKSQVRVIKMDGNCGLSAVRKAGVEAATGDYVIFCDPDDHLDEELYDTLARAAASSGSEMVFCDFYAERAGHMRIQSAPRHIANDPHRLVRRVGLGEVHAGLWRVLIARHLFLQVRHWPQGNISEDCVLLCQMLCACRTKIEWVYRPLYYYVLHPGQSVHPATREANLYTLGQRKMNYEALRRFLDEAHLPDSYKMLMVWQMTDKLRLALLKCEPDYVTLQRQTYPDLRLSRVLLTPDLPKGLKRRYLLMTLRVWKRALKKTNNQPCQKSR